MVNSAAVTSMRLADIMDEIAALEAERARADARSLQLLGELERRRGYEADGATSLDRWATERLGISVATSRARCRAAVRIYDLPHLAAGLAEGELTFDKLQAVLPIATPENDADLRAQARRCTVRQLHDMTTSALRPPAPTEDYEGRFLRFHDECRTVTAKLPPESYAECRALLEERAKTLPSDGEVSWDHRLCDAFLQILRGGKSAHSDPDSHPAPPNFMVVIHAPLSSIAAGPSAAGTIGGELERRGLLDRATVHRIACDATVVLALDNDVGHTMYEGRSKRLPTAAQRREIIRRDRHCRFPGCTNATFTNAHHITQWLVGGPTDLPNLVLLCEHHHHRIHENGWSVQGDANKELIFRGPSGRDLVSRPSPRWGHIVEAAERTPPSPTG
jgi:hypothetical protein